MWLVKSVWASGRQDTEAKTQHPAESTGSHEPEHTHSARMDVLQLSVNCISRVVYFYYLFEAFSQDVYEKWGRTDPRMLGFFGVPRCQDQNNECILTYVEITKSLQLN